MQLDGVNYDLYAQYRDSDCFALLECDSELTADSVDSIFEDRRLDTIEVAERGHIVIQGVVTHERWVQVIFNGDPLIGYSAFFQWCETNLHRVALIRIGEARYLPADDKYDLESMEDAEGMQHRSQYFQKQEARLINSFLKKVVFANHTPDALKRIITMCRLGEFSNGCEELAFAYFESWYPRANTLNDLDKFVYWEQAIRKCHTSSDDYREWVSGDSLMTRIMIHLLYLEELNPTSWGERRAAKGKGLRRLSLG